MNSYGPRITTNGLVAHLDVGNQKGFVGEPTVNLISDPLALTGNPGSVSWGGIEYTVTRTSTLPDSDMAKISPYWLRCDMTALPSARVAVLGVSGLTPGVDYCFSAYVYSNDPNITDVRLVSHNGGVSTDQSVVPYGSADLYKIKRIYTIFRSVAGSQLEVLQTNNDISTGSFYITGVQCEQKSYPTPIVNGTRGSTVATGGGLYDLSGNNKHGEINGPIYSSVGGGSLVFDGVDDYTLGSVPVTNNSNITVTGFAKITYNTAGCIFKVGSGCAGYSLGIGNDAYYTSGSNIIALYSCVRWISTSVQWRRNGWNGFALSIDGSGNALFYNDGQLVHVSSGSAPLAVSSEYYLGRCFGDEASAGERAFEGNVASIQVYNRMLSPDEILNNFNASKGRFGL